jgi:RsiW-degrading membrane proteinase PrsW (M82 family)
MQNIFFGILLFFITLIPILFWGYLFSHFDNEPLNRKRFAVWILAWGISVVPVLYLEDFINSTNLFYINIFSLVSQINSFFDLFKIFLSFFSILFFISFIPFFIFSSISNINDKIKNFLKNYLVFMLYLTVFWLIFYFLDLIFDKFDIFQKSYDFWLSFWNVLFNSFKLVVFYYLIIAILEELSKFFCFNYSKLFSIIDVKKSVLYAIFVALGFAFFENMLYFKKLYELYWIWKDLVVVYFSRNIFSIVLHVLCSSVLAYYFSLVYLKFKEKLNLEFIKILFIWFLFAVILHSLFDIFLTFNLTFFIFIYLIWSYFYLTYIFYAD